jgi:hypothetical protein
MKELRYYSRNGYQFQTRYHGIPEHLIATRDYD